jgi:hypothetical protein
MESPGTESPPRKAGARQTLFSSSIFNFRDIHMTCPSNIPAKRIYRSSPPYSGSKQDINILTDELFVKTVLDFRSEAERRPHAVVEKASHLWKTGIQVRSFPLISQGKKFFRVLSQLLQRQDITTAACLLLIAPLGLVVESERQRTLRIVIPEMNKMGLRGYYRQIIDDTRDGIRQALEAFTKPASFPILVHCTGGKDRTGVVVALVQCIVGVPRELIEEEFAMSEEWLEEIAVANGNVSVGLYEAHMHRAPPEALRDLFGYIDRKYESVGSYLRYIGFGDEKQQLLRRCVLEGGGASIPRARL